MEGNIPILICLIVILLPALKAAYNSLRIKEFDYVLNEVTGSFSLIVSIFIIFNFFKPLNNWINTFVSSLDLSHIIEYLLKMGLLIGSFLVINSILYNLFRIINRFLIWKQIEFLEDKSFFRFIISTFLGAIKGFLTLILIFIAIIFINKSGVIDKQINIFNNIKVYNILEQNVDTQKISEIKSGLIKDSNIPTIVYYNGVTLSQGVKSDSAINEKALEITRNAKTDLEKARIIYAWIGSNITYDDKKAEEVMNGDKNVKSGAIVAFNTRTGICFDYACLYVAMARAVGLPVRLITGTAFNGKEYISHAWNQVYIKSLGKWINVDPTFYKAGDYFNNSNFNADHKEESIAGQWN